MKAFLTGVALMLAVTVIAAFTTTFVPGQSSKDVYQDRPNVRL
jgi:FlaG/FlaF family flagellin (archaellin)